MRTVTRNGGIVDEDDDDDYDDGDGDGDGEGGGGFGEAGATSGKKRRTGSGDGAHVRIGWGRREASLNGPVGLDGYSYGIRDGTGEKVTLSRPRPYGKPFGTGDVVGCLIHIPPLPQSKLDEKRQRQRVDPREPSRIQRKRIPIRYKGQLYFESVEYTVAKEMDALVARDGKSNATALGIANGDPRPQMDQGRDRAADKEKMPKPEPEKTGKGNNKRSSKKSGVDKKSSTTPVTAAAATTPANPEARYLPSLQGSTISFFLNGQPMSDQPAFRDLFDFVPLRQSEQAQQGSKKVLGSEAFMKERENHFDDGSLGYYPMVSCYGGGKVQLNPGPEWLKPVDLMDWKLGSTVGQDGFELPIVPRPMYERWDEWCSEETVNDEIDEARSTEELKKRRVTEIVQQTERKPKTTGKGAKGKNSQRGRTKGSTSLKRDSRTPAGSTPGPYDLNSEPSESFRSTPIPTSFLPDDSRPVSEEASTPPAVPTADSVDIESKINYEDDISMHGEQIYNEEQIVKMEVEEEMASIET